MTSRATASRSAATWWPQEGSTALLTSTVLKIDVLFTSIELIMTIASNRPATFCLGL